MPSIYHTEPRDLWVKEYVSLKVGRNKPNAFGLYDMHGNVEEWCYDWYGPYESGDQIDPVGRAIGIFRVIRGGSHNTMSRYLRSANRMGTLPNDRQWVTGFRVVQANMPDTRPLPALLKPAVMKNVNQSKYNWVSKREKPYFISPIPFVKTPNDYSDVVFYQHNHCPAIIWCLNGDLLAIWFSTITESGREMTILGSRLQAGKNEWDEPSEFFKAPDRNMTGSALLNDGDGTIYHTNGVKVADTWRNLVPIIRTSTDNGATWSEPKMINTEHGPRNQIIAGLFISKEGWLIQNCDSDPGPSGGTNIYISEDKGKTWFNPTETKEEGLFEAGKNGSNIAGIHAGIVQLQDGRLLALGRDDNIKDLNGILRMPMSISSDIGRTWTYSASEFPPIFSGQRLVLFRLQEGPILLLSFTHHPSFPQELRGMEFSDSKGRRYKAYGIFAALSYDEGKTWPIKKFLTDGKKRTIEHRSGIITIDATHNQLYGYLAITQTPDGTIHLISSALYYCFNLKWLEQSITIQH